MIIGTTKELKNHEYRVGLIPDNVSAFVAKGHKVLVETQAGLGAGFLDQDYIDAGAEIVATPAEVFAQCFIVPGCGLGDPVRIFRSEQTVKLLPQRGRG